MFETRKFSKRFNPPYEMNRKENVGCNPPLARFNFSFNRLENASLMRLNSSNGLTFVRTWITLNLLLLQKI